MTPGARVLVVDDEPQLQRALTTNLKARGYEVDNAATGEKALELFEKAILSRPEVLECYLMTGDSDYLLRVVCADLEAFERFLMNHLTKVVGISSIRSSFALKQVKYSTALPLGETPRKGNRRRNI